MITLVQKTATIRPDGRMDFAVPELPPGTVADVIVVVQSTPPTYTRPEATASERVAALNLLRANVHITDAQAATWAADIRAERLAWRLPGDEPD